MRIFFQSILLANFCFISPFILAQNQNVESIIVDQIPSDYYLKFSVNKDAWQPNALPVIISDEDSNPLESTLDAMNSISNTNNYCASWNLEIEPFLPDSILNNVYPNFNVENCNTEMKTIWDIMPDTVIFPAGFSQSVSIGMNYLVSNLSDDSFENLLINDTLLVNEINQMFHYLNKLGNYIDSADFNQGNLCEDINDTLYLLPYPNFQNDPEDGNPELDEYFSTLDLCTSFLDTTLESYRNSYDSIFEIFNQNEIELSQMHANMLAYSSTNVVLNSFESQSDSSIMELSTDNLYGPHSISSENTFYSVQLTWEVGTDVPNELHGYKIKRKSQSGQEAWVYEQDYYGQNYLDSSQLNLGVDFQWLTFIDYATLPGETYTYEVHTQVNSDLFDEFPLEVTNNYSITSQDFAEIQVTTDDLPIGIDFSAVNNGAYGCDSIALSWSLSSDVTKSYSDLKYQIIEVLESNENRVVGEQVLWSSSSTIENSDVTCDDNYLSNCMSLSFDLDPNLSSQETPVSWKISNEESFVVASGVVQGIENDFDSICLEPGSYTFAFDEEVVEEEQAYYYNQEYQVGDEYEGGILHHIYEDGTALIKMDSLLKPTSIKDFVSYFVYDSVHVTFENSGQTIYVPAVTNQVYVPEVWITDCQEVYVDAVFSQNCISIPYETGVYIIGIWIPTGIAYTEVCIPILSEAPYTYNDCNTYLSSAAYTYTETISEAYSYVQDLNVPITDLTPSSFDCNNLRPSNPENDIVNNSQYSGDFNLNYPYWSNTSWDAGCMFDTIAYRFKPPYVSDFNDQIWQESPFFDLFNGQFMQQNYPNIHALVELFNHLNPGENWRLPSSAELSHTTWIPTNWATSDNYDCSCSNMKVQLVKQVTLPSSFPYSISMNAGSALLEGCEDVEFPGCTNPKSINYDEDATLDNESCLVLGCTNTLASNYTVGANSDDGSCLLSENDETCAAYNEKLTIEVATDHYGEEATWQMINKQGYEVLSKGPYSHADPGVKEVFNYCANSGNAFTIHYQDTYGDGWLTELFKGYIRISNDSDQELFYSEPSGAAGSSSFVVLEDTLSQLNIEIEGCTNHFACNFNALANVSAPCDIPSECEICSITFEDGSGYSILKDYNNDGICDNACNTSSTDLFNDTEAQNNQFIFEVASEETSCMLNTPVFQCNESDLPLSCNKMNIDEISSYESPYIPGFIWPEFKVYWEVVDQAEKNVFDFNTFQFNKVNSQENIDGISYGGSCDLEVVSTPNICLPTGDYKLRIYHDFNVDFNINFNNQTFNVVGLDQFVFSNNNNVFEFSINNEDVDCISEPLVNYIEQSLVDTFITNIEPGSELEYRLHTMTKNPITGDWIPSKEFVAINSNKLDSDLEIIIEGEFVSKKENHWSQVSTVSEFYGVDVQNRSFLLSFPNLSNNESIKSISVFSDMSEKWGIQTYNNVMQNQICYPCWRNGDEEILDAPILFSGDTLLANIDLSSNVNFYYPDTLENCADGCSIGESVESQFDFFIDNTVLDNDLLVFSPFNHRILEQESSLNFNTLIQSGDTFTFWIEAETHCGSTIRSNDLEVIIHDNLPNTFFNENNSLKASKGYFPDKIKIEWQTDSTHLIDHFSLKRKLSIAGSEWVTIESNLGNEDTQYLDNDAQAGKLYEYKLEAYIPIDGVLSNNESNLMSYSNIYSQDIGFRMPVGSISGTVTFVGNTPVPSVKIIAESTNEVSSSSLYLNGENSTVDFSKVSTELGWNDASASNSFTFSSWVKLNQNVSSPMVLFSALQRSESNELNQKDPLFNLYYGSGKYNVHWGKDTPLSDSQTGVPSSTSVQDSSSNFNPSQLSYYQDPNVTIDFDNSENVLKNWHNLSLSFNDETNIFKVYVNGLMVHQFYYDFKPNGTLFIGGSQSIDYVLDTSVSSLTTINSSFNHQYNQFYTEGVSKHEMIGNLDEIAFYNTVLEDIDVNTNSKKFIPIDFENLVAYYQCNESFGNNVFDISKTIDVFNENDIRLNSNTMFNNDIPSASRISYNTYTDSLGNYMLENVRYFQSGSQFNVSPSTILPYYNINHEFSPSQRNVFIGDGQNINQGIDFIDISSFTVSGTVYYLDIDSLNQNNDTIQNICTPVAGAILNIDGSLVLDENNNTISTDNAGQFTIEVPIGSHTVSVTKNGHKFFYNPQIHTESGKVEKLFYQDYTFTENTFIDVSTRIVKGRAVGGYDESIKTIGFDLSSNNIGMAYFDFESMKYPCHSVSVATDSVSGEYTAILLPEDYTVSFGLGTNSFPIETNPVLAFPNPGIMSFPDTIELTTVEHLNADDELLTSSFHKQVDFIHRETPYVTLNESFGSSEIKVSQTEAVFLDNEVKFSHDVLLAGQNYNCAFKVYEQYVNRDSDEDIIDDVLVIDPNSFLQINNGLSSTSTIINLPIEPHLTGTPYKFECGAPEINNGAKYLKSMTVAAFTPGNNPVYWDPNATENDPNDDVYQAYILGAKANLGSGLFTKGPELVDFILRDPPGDGSYAYIEAGTQVETEVTTGFETYYQSDELIHISTFPKFNIGVGISLFGITANTDLETEVRNHLNLKFERGTETVNNNTIIFSDTYLDRFETNSDASSSTFHEGDLFVGESTNISYSLANNINVLSSDNVVDHTFVVDSLIYNSQKYYLTKFKAAQITEHAYNSTFIYSQAQILNFLIPQLITTRNAYFSDPNSGYVSHYTSIEEGYGSENDASNLNNGASYTFSGSGLNQVSFINQQIRLWQEAVKRNELEKVQNFGLKLNGDAVSTNLPYKSYTLSSGVSFEYNETSSFESVTYVDNVTYQLEDRHAEQGAFINDAGASVDYGWFRKNITRSSSSKSTSSSSGYGYVLNDNTYGDVYEVNAFESKGKNGLMFNVNSGQSACPYIGQAKTHFINDVCGDDFCFLNGATLRREVPVLTVNGLKTDVQFNIPETESAVFNLELMNNSESGDLQIYDLKINEATNPYGAILKIDGLSINRDYEIPADGLVNKTLTFGKGPSELQYGVSETGQMEDPIEIIIHSQCQFDPTDNTENIADTISVAATFIASCSDVSFTQPSNSWVVNSDNIVDDVTEMKIIISDYNLNYYSLKSIDLLYKPTNSSEWIPLNSYKKDPADGEIPIPAHFPYIEYDWVMPYIDGPYDIKSVATCQRPFSEPVLVESEVLSGIMDRQRPIKFGSPSPADGILDVGDEIQINFNEDILEAHLAYHNFSISGVLNGSEIRHDASLYFDGSDVMTIPSGLSLKNKSFTIEMWVRPQGNSGTILQQGYQDGDALSIQVTDDHKVEFALSGETYKSATSIQMDDWTHVALVYNHSDNEVHFLLNGDDQGEVGALFVDYQGEGPISIGDGFDGNIHELRIWNTDRKTGDITSNQLKKLNVNTAHLSGYWPMNELTGQPLDVSRYRNASTNATWQVIPAGHAIEFNAANQDQIISNTDIALRKEQDFTVELWFKSSAQNQTLFTNGSSVFDDQGVLFGNVDGWTIGLNSSGKIEVINNLDTLTSTHEFNDNNWNHIALVKDSEISTILFVNGNQEITDTKTINRGFGGASISLGANLDIVGLEVPAQYFDGLIDEVRVWGKARKLNQIVRDSRIALKGDELGLLAYYPFERFENGTDTYTSLLDAHLDETIYNAYPFEGTHTFTQDVPLVKKSRSTEPIQNFTFTSNDDKIILTINEDLSKIEGCILDIEVSGVEDLYLNQMASPETWTAYINQNDLIWNDQEVNLNKELGQPLAFTTSIVNTGGRLQNFEISNLPTWLTLVSNQDFIEPNSYTQLDFVVNDDLFIGEYSEDILLTGSNNYSERLELNLSVESQQPEYEINPSDFMYSMNFIGQVSVDDFISRDPRDVLFAYVGEEMRGASKPFYIESLDKYYLFLDVYSNVNDLNAETLDFRLWDASQGKMHVKVLPDDLNFTSNELVGTVTNPQVFEATNKLRQEIELSSGWNWLSFNLNPEDEFTGKEISLETLTPMIDVPSIETLKSQEDFATPYTNDLGETSLIGSLTRVEIGQMYMLKMNGSDTLAYDGEIINPKDSLYYINIESGWNWVGYSGQRLMNVNEALSSLNPAPNDLLKGQESFCIYFNDEIGWVGTLSSLEPGKGYMMKSEQSQTLIYPENSMYGNSIFRLSNNQVADDYWAVQPTKYQNTMSVIAKIDHPDYVLPNKHNILGAFTFDDCVGNIDIQVIDQELSLYLLTIYGNQEELMTFKYYDRNQEILWSTLNVVPFETNKVLGSFNEPYEINLDQEIDLVENSILQFVYPNPFENNITHQFVLEEESAVKIQFTDIFGRVVKVVQTELYDAGVHKVLYELNDLSSGVFLINIEIGSASYHKKIIKM